MRILLSSLVLLCGLNVILSRSLQWTNSDDYYDLFFPPLKRDKEYNILKAAFDSSEESIETATKDTSDSQEGGSNERRFKIFNAYLDTFGSILGVIDPTSDEVKAVNDDDKSKGSNESSEEIKVIDDDDNDNDGGGNNYVFKLISVIGDSEEKKVSSGERFGDESSEEIKIIDVDDNNGSNNYAFKLISVIGDSEEKKELYGENSVEVNVADHDIKETSEERSGEDNSEADVEISEHDIKELTAVLLTLSAMDDLIKITKNYDSIDSEESSEEALKEIEEFLILFGSLVDKAVEEAKDANGTNSESDGNNTNENHNTRDDVSKLSNGEENNNDSPIVIYFGIDNNEDNTVSLDNHKYDIVEDSTTPEISSSTSINRHVREDGDNVVEEYAEIRQKLDKLQNTLSEDELNLDKDFYAVLDNKSDNKNMKKFEEDIVVANQDLYKIKQNIEALKNLQSKLYFHKLVKAAIKEAQHKLN